jgi:acyl-CoA thioesterase
VVDLQERIARDSGVLARLGITVAGQSEDGIGLRMLVSADMLNAGGVCHGGFLFALADTACAYAVAEAGVTPITVDASMTYLRGAQLNAEVVAVARVTRAGRRLGHCDVSLALADGTEVALYRGTCANVETPG